jgi:hypothetical protein
MSNGDLDKYKEVRALLDLRRDSEAFQKCRSYALEGSTSCRNLLAWMHQAGIGTEQNAREAERLYTDTARAGSPIGRFFLAKLAFQERRPDEAIFWLEKAASENYAPALFRLGLAYKTGRGVPTDHARAGEYFQRAADLGHIFARRELAIGMINGERGIWMVPIGLASLVSALVTGAKLGYQDHRDDRLIT